MTSMHLKDGEALLLEIADTEGFKKRCPEQFDALVECSAAVNQRCVEADQSPYLSLLFL